MSEFDWNYDPNAPWGTSFEQQPEPSKPKNKMLLWLSIGAGAAAIGLVTLIVLAVTNFNSGQPRNSAAPDYSQTPTTPSTPNSFSDLYKEPTNLDEIVRSSREATVTVACGNAIGSGWGVNLSTRLVAGKAIASAYTLVTNHHVVDECLDGSGISIRLLNQDEWIQAELLGYDNFSDRMSNQQADLAILGVDVQIPALTMAAAAPEAGEWSMAVGNPASGAFNDMEGHVTFGHVSNYKEEAFVLVTDTALNHGNSGGPLINARGQVIGINTWLDTSQDSQNVGYAISVAMLCERLLTCPADDPIKWPKR